MKRKILIFSEYYYPAKNYGGPLTSIRNIVNTCSDEFDFYLVSYNHDFNDPKPFENIANHWNQVDKAKVLYCDDKTLKFNVKEIVNILNMEKFDLVWLTGIFRPEKKWIVIKYCNKKGIPVIISPRGEVSPGAINLKRTKKLIYSHLVKLTNLFKKTYFHITHNDELLGLKKYFNISESQIFFAPNIAVDEIGSCEKTKDSGKIDFVFISRIHKKKNLKYAVEKVVKLSGNVSFDIYGPIEDENYWKEIEEIIEAAPDNVTIKYMGSVNPEDVSKVFCKYHFLLFPTLSENYGHVIVEAMINSCPPVISEKTTPWDDMNEFTGLVLPLSDEVAFTRKLQHLVDVNNEEYQEYLKQNFKYINKKMIENDAVQKHKDMINVIIDKHIN